MASTRTVLTLLAAGFALGVSAIASAACDQNITWAVPGALADWESTTDYCKWQVTDPEGDELNGNPSDDLLSLAYTHSEAPNYTDIFLLTELAGAPATNASYVITHTGTDGTSSTFTTKCTTAAGYTCTSLDTGTGTACTAACTRGCAATCVSTGCSAVDVTCTTTLEVVASTDGKCAGGGPFDYTTTVVNRQVATEPDGVGLTTVYYLLTGGANMTAACYPYYANTTYAESVVVGTTTEDSVSDTDTSPNDYTGSTAVNLLRFEAHPSPSGTDLVWDTGSEHGTIGFIVHRDSSEGPAVNASMIHGQLESPIGQRYTLHDPEGRPDTAYYLEELSTRGRHLYGAAHWESAASLEPRVLRSPHLIDVCRGEPNLLPIRPLTVVEDGFVRTSSEGIYTLTPAQLSQLGLTTTAQLSHDGAAYPLFSLPSGDVAFYAPASNSPERATDAYELAPGSTALPSPEAVSPALGSYATQFTSTVHAEQHTMINLGSEPDHRFPWNYAYGPGAPTTFNFDAPGLESGASAVTVRLIGLTDFNHDAQIEINGVAVPDAIFSGAGETVVTASLPSGTLLASGNVLTLNAVPDPTEGYDLVGLISIDSTYPRTFQAAGNALSFTASAGTSIEVTGFSGSPLVFDITNPASPQLVSGALVTVGRGNTTLRFTVPAASGGARTSSTYYAAVPTAASLTPSLAGDVPSGSASYVAIVGSGLASALQPLLSERQAQGLSVLSVDVEALYDRFNYGEHGPEAIATFLGQLSPAPTYVLLVGKPSVDPHDYLATGTPDLVPAPYIFTVDFDDLAVDDGQYVAAADGLTPTIAIGRLPAESAAELTPWVQKLVAYETSGAGPSGIGVWAADDEDPDTGASDPFFVSESNKLEGQFPAQQAVQVYLPDQSTSALLSGLAQGPDLVSYHGHADGLDWSTSGLFSSSDVSAIPAARPFFLVTVDCWDGMYAMPTFAPLAQQIAEVGQGGALAAFSASSLVDEARDPGIDQAIYGALASAGATTVGQVTLAAEQALAAQAPPANDLARVYNLIGDPATTLPLR